MTGTNQSNRIQKVNSLIQKLLNEILLPYTRNLKDIVTITKVETSRDLRWAKVWVSVVNGNGSAAINVLKKDIYDIQGQLNRKLSMKTVPRISFWLDTSGEYVDHIEKLFKKIKQEQEKTGE